jgi:hypothetical protein
MKKSVHKGRREPKTPPMTQKEKLLKCNMTGCKWPKKPEDLFCWPHFFKLSKELRGDVAHFLHFSKVDKNVRKDLLRRARAYLTKACAPLN